MTHYTWDPDTMKVMSQNDFCRFIALSYLRLRLIQDHASGLLRTTVKRDASQMSTYSEGPHTCLTGGSHRGEGSLVGRAAGSAPRRL